MNTKEGRFEQFRAMIGKPAFRFYQKGNERIRVSAGVILSITPKGTKLTWQHGDDPNQPGRTCDHKAEKWASDWPLFALRDDIELAAIMEDEQAKRSADFRAMQEAEASKQANRDKCAEIVETISGSLQYCHNAPFLEALAAIAKHAPREWDS